MELFSFLVSGEKYVRKARQARKARKDFITIATPSTLRWR
jgi:hypothetical protein